MEIEHLETPTGREQRSRKARQTVAAETDDAQRRMSRESARMNGDEVIVLKTDDLQGISADQRVIVESGDE